MATRILRGKPCPEKEKEKRFTVRFFSVAWEESPHLRHECSAADALIELALWVKSRSEDRSEACIVLSVYQQYPYITIEESGVSDGK